MFASRLLVVSARTRAAAGAGASASARAMSSAGASKDFGLRTPFQYHLLPDAGITSATATKDELMHYFTEMYTVRRMEISCDTEYKARNIRGFCHLYDGQEAVGMGLQAALSKDDNIATSYRCHGLQYFRGDSVKRIVGELFGFELGTSKGKGGSMHMYSKQNRFWGGAGIVGAQIPIAGGLAFAERYKTKGASPMNVAVGMYGDGAANQGQVWETANMAKLWKLPLILLCENNQYGMGTATNRHSCQPEYYKQGGMVIPGVQCDGMDVLSVREAVKFCRNHTSSGQGPIFLEVKTYRYHGHSMSDPGITYRDRDEVAKMRAGRDCIEQVKARLLEASWATEAELKDVEKAVRAKVAGEVEEARKGALPRPEQLYADILKDEVPSFIRMPDFPNSLRFA